MNLFGLDGELFAETALIFLRQFGTELGMRNSDQALGALAQRLPRSCATPYSVTI